MARSKKIPHAPTGNVTGDTFLEFYDRLVEAVHAKDAAAMALANVYRAAERAGIDKKQLKRAYAESQKTADEREIDDGKFRQYMDWLGKPVGTQAEMFRGDPEAAQAPSPEASDKHDASQAHYAGHDAGRAGANIDSNPHQPGTEAFAEWRGGWGEGQAAAVAALGGATRRVPMPA